MQEGTERSGGTTAARNSGSEANANEKATRQLGREERADRRRNAIAARVRAALRARTANAAMKAHAHSAVHDSRNEGHWPTTSLMGRSLSDTVLNALRSSLCYFHAQNL